MQSIICNIKCEQHGRSKSDVRKAQLRNKASLENTTCNKAIWTPAIREELLTRDPACIRARPLFMKHYVQTRLLFEPRPVFEPVFYSDKYGM